jgi:hypothetical protein
MNEERSKILSMLADGKITVADAERLLDAINVQENEEFDDELHTKTKHKYLYVVVEGGDDNVNIRVPLQLFYAGIQFASLIPEQARKKIESGLEEKGINLNVLNMKPEAVDEVINALGDFEVNIEEKDGERVRIYCK